MLRLEILTVSDVHELDSFRTKKSRQFLKGDSRSLGTKNMTFASNLSFGAIVLGGTAGTKNEKKAAATIDRLDHPAPPFLSAESSI
jgi:hypothetical protein